MKMLELGKTNIKEKSLAEIGLTARTDYKFYAPPWLYDGSATMLFAPTGHGKSHYAFHLALAIAEGGTWLGHQCTKAKILYIDGEMGESQWLRRFPNNKYLADTQDTLRIICPEHFPSGFIYSLADKKNHEFWLNKCEPYDIIFIDNYFTTCLPSDGRESEVSLWQNTQTLIKRLTSRLKSVVLIHHTNKSGLDQSGTGQRDAIMDTTMRLRQWPLQYLENGLTWEIKIPKDRNDFFKNKKETLIDVIFTDDGISTRERDIKAERKIIAMEMHRKGCTKPSIAKLLGIEDYEVSELVYEINKNETNDEDLI